MNALRTLVSAILAVSPSLAISQDLEDVLEKFGAGNMAITAGETAILVPFAMEWDNQSAAAMDLPLSAVDATRYEAIAKSTANRFDAASAAFSGAPDALAYFSRPEALEAFDETYTTAKENGSAVGVIPYDLAKRYWILSQALVVDPADIRAFPEIGPSVHWCMPPLIRCTPPELDPPQE